MLTLGCCQFGSAVAEEGVLRSEEEEVVAQPRFEVSGFGYLVIGLKMNVHNIFHESAN